MTTPYVKVYSPEDREKKRAINRKSAQKNKEKVYAENALYRKLHPLTKEQRAANAKRFAIKNPEKIQAYRRRADLKKKYGITPEQYDSMLSRQGGVCAICRKPNTTSRRFHIDHDHSTGKIRSILCHYCNVMLGGARDNPETLAAGIRYLTESP